MIVLASDVRWGTVSDWVAGAATVVAVVVALVFSLRSERDQLEARLANVHAWFEIQPIGGGAARQGVLRLANNTEYPIYEWTVIVEWPRRLGELVTATTGHVDHGLLPPGRHEFAFRDAREDELPANDADVRVELRFRDALGRQRDRMPVRVAKRGTRDA